MTDKGAPTDKNFADKRLVDSDGDGLDDRIVDPKNASRDLGDIIKRVSNLTLGNLPSELLKRMLTDVEAKQEKLTNDAADIEIKLHGQLLAGDTSGLADSRKNVRLLGRENREVERQRNKIYTALQERVVFEGMSKKLGSDKRAKRFEMFIFALIIGVLGMMTYEFMHPELPQSTHDLFFIIDVSCCIIFLIEFFLRLAQADDKRWFWRHNWIDFVTSIPVPNLQAVRYGRALRLLRLVRLLRVVRMVRSLLKVFKGLEKLEDTLDVHMMKKSLKLLLVLVLLGAICIQLLEGVHGEAVREAGDSLWWSFTTVVTGGFGDLHNPASGVGRTLTVILVISGMIVVGVFTATLTTVIMTEENEALEARQEALEDHMAALSSAHVETIAHLKGISEQLGRRSDSGD